MHQVVLSPQQSLSSLDSNEAGLGLGVLNCCDWFSSVDVLSILFSLICLNKALESSQNGPSLLSLSRGLEGVGIGFLLVTGWECSATEIDGDHYHSIV